MTDRVISKAGDFLSSPEVEDMVGNRCIDDVPLGFDRWAFWAIGRTAYAHAVDWGVCGTFHSSSPGRLAASQQRTAEL